MRDKNWFYFLVQTVLMVGTVSAFIAARGEWVILLGVILGYGVGQSFGFLLLED